MLALFRTNQLLTSVLLLFYLGALHGYAFFNPVELGNIPMGIGMEWIYHLVGKSGWLANLFSILVLFTNGFLLNVLVSEQRFAKEVNLFPGLFYCLLSSAFPNFLALLPVHLANTFLILVLFEMLSIYRKPSCADRIFNIGFWISVASLFYFSYIVFLLLAIISLTIFRAFRLREQFMVIIGALTPYILVGTILFLTDQFPALIQQHFWANLAFLPLLNIQLEKHLPELIFFSIILLVVLTSYGLYMSRKNIEAQKKIDLIYWGILISAFSLFIQTNIPIWQLLFLAPFLGIFLALTFENLGNQTAEVLHILVLLGILFIQYQGFFL